MTIPTKIDITHRWYGCETGCCGHRVTAEIDATHETDQFFFEHPWEALPLQFAHDLVRQAYAGSQAIRDTVDAAGGYVIDTLDTSED